MIFFLYLGEIGIILSTPITLSLKWQNKLYELVYNNKINYGNVTNSSTQHQCEDKSIRT